MSTPSLHFLILFIVDYLITLNCSKANQQYSLSKSRIYTPLIEAISLSPCSLLSFATFLSLFVKERKISVHRLASSLLLLIVEKENCSSLLLPLFLSSHYNFDRYIHTQTLRTILPIIIAALSTLTNIRVE